MVFKILVRDMFRDRTQVGKLLAEKIKGLEINNPIVLAIPRGGVPVAREIALALRAPMDLVITRKIGAPGEPEFAVGAVTQDGEMIVDKETVRMLGISDNYLQEEKARQTREIHQRMRKYRGDLAFPNLTGRTVIIVDDGVATGNTMLSAIESLRKKKPKNIIVAVGVAPEDTVTNLSRVANQVICLAMPEPFFAIGQFYEKFDQVEDEQVRGILSEVNSKTSLQLH